MDNNASLETPVKPLFSNNKMKIFISVGLGLIVVAGSFVIGIKVGRDQVRNELSRSIQPVITPTQETINPVASQESLQVTLVPSVNQTPSVNPSPTTATNTRYQKFNYLPVNFNYSGWQQLTISDLGFRIKVPSGWRIKAKDIKTETITLSNFSVSDEELLKKKGSDPEWLFSDEGYALSEKEALSMISIDVSSKEPVGYNVKDGYEYYCSDKNENVFQEKTYCVLISDPQLPSTGVTALSATYYFKSGSKYYSITIESKPTIFIGNIQETEDSENVKKAIVASFEFIQ